MPESPMIPPGPVIAPHLLEDLPRPVAVVLEELVAVLIAI